MIGSSHGSVGPQALVSFFLLVFHDYSDLGRALISSFLRMISNIVFILIFKADLLLADVRRAGNRLVTHERNQFFRFPRVQVLQIVIVEISDLVFPSPLASVINRKPFLLKRRRSLRNIVECSPGDPVLHAKRLFIFINLNRAVTRDRVNEILPRTHILMIGS